MPDTTHKQLHNHTPVTTVPLGPKASMLFGVPFLAMGTFVVLVGAGVIPTDQESMHAPPWVVGAVGAVFAMAGVLFLSNGLLGMRRESRARHVRRLHPDEPWLSDYRWEHAGIRDRSRTKLVRYVVMAILFPLFLAPFNWWGFYSDEGPMFVKIVVGVFDGVWVLLVLTMLVHLCRMLKFGRNRLRFVRFPFFLGDKLDVHLSNSRGIGHYKTIDITLRCIQERIETHGTGKNRRTRIVCYELYNDTLTVEGPDRHRAGDPPIPISFPLPEGDYVTSLSDRPARYWELQVHADIPGLDLKAAFLVPVYAKPGARFRGEG